jgi:TM2 domain-containing membrane protein YozV
MPLQTDEKILIEQRVTNEAKSAGVGYLLLIFLGWLGAHRFYLGATGSGIVMLLLWVIGTVTSVIGVGFVLLAIWGIWWVIDLFLIPGMVSRQKDEVRERLTRQALSGGI